MLVCALRGGWKSIKFWHFRKIAFLLVWEWISCVVFRFRFFSLVSAAWTTIVFWVWPHVFKGCVEPKALYSLCDCDDLCFNLAQRERKKNIYIYIYIYTLSRSSRGLLEGVQLRPPKPEFLPKPLVLCL